MKELESFTSSLPTGEEQSPTVKGNYTAKSGKASEKFLESISSMGYDLTAMESVLKGSGNQLVLACAGAGKTTATIFKIIYETKTGELIRKVEVNGNTIRTMARVWVSTFLRTGANELRHELSKWNKKLGYVDTSSSIKFSTLHAEFMSALNDCGYKTDIIDSVANSKILKNIVASHGVKRMGRVLTSKDLRDLEGAITYTRNRLDNKRYIHDVYKECGLSPIEIDNIISSWSNARSAANKCDFEDLQDIIYHNLYVSPDESFIKFIADRYEYLYIDEFQDTSQKQYAILKAYILGAKKVVVVGDDDQTIYSWRGSDSSIITTQFIKDFDPTVTALDINFRCPANIINAIKPSIEKNTNRLEKGIKAYKEGGSLRIGRYKGISEMVSELEDLIYKDVSNGLTVAVICRENIDALLPAIMLDTDGRFSYSISSEESSLSSYVAKQALDIVRLVNEKTTKGVSNALKQLTYSKWEVDSLISACKNSNESIWNIDMLDVKYSCPSLYPIISEWRNARNSYKDDISFAGYLLAYYYGYAYNGDSIYEDRMRSIINAIIVLLENGNFSSISEFLYEVEEMNLRLKGRVKAKNVNVSIVTSHEFKGKERESVYVWNDTAHVFPHKKAVTPEEYEEERRVHYIACTRATKQLSIMTIKGREGAFVGEMDLSCAEELQSGVSFSGSLKGIEDSEEARNRKKFRGEL